LPALAVATEWFEENPDDDGGDDENKDFGSVGDEHWM